MDNNNSVVPELTKRKRRGPFMEVMFRLSKSPLAMFGLAIIMILVFCAIFAEVIAPYSPIQQDLVHRFETPTAAHWLGTDEFGRDILSRLIYGARVSLQVGFIAVGIALITGGMLGAISGYYSGWLDNCIMRVMDVLLSIPQTLLAIAIVAALGPSLMNLMIAVGISAVPTYARIVRGSVLSIRSMEFIGGARRGQPRPPHNTEAHPAQQHGSHYRAVNARRGVGHTERGWAVVHWSWHTAAQSRVGRYALRRQAVYPRFPAYDALSGPRDNVHDTRAELPRRRASRRA